MVEKQGQNLDAIEIALSNMTQKPVRIQHLIKDDLCRAYIYNESERDIECEDGKSAPPEICWFCEEDLVQDETCIEFPCGHSFHYDCLYSYLNLSKRYSVECPTCKQLVEVK